MTAAKDQRISLDLEVEILTDADTGVPELVVDNDVVTADEARTKVAEAARTLVATVQVISDYEDTVCDPTEAAAVVDVLKSFVFAVRPEALRGDARVTARPFCEKYDWCVEHDLSDGYTGHYGPNASVMLAASVPVGLGTGQILRAQVYASDQYGGPEVWASVDRYDELVLNAEQLGALIESLDDLRPALVQMRDQVAEVPSAGSATLEVHGKAAR